MPDGLFALLELAELAYHGVEERLRGSDDADDESGDGDDRPDPAPEGP